MDALTKAGEKPWNQIMLDTELKKKDGTILYCKAHILYRQNVEEIKYLVRLDYDLETQIRMLYLLRHYAKARLIAGIGI